jgi:hypothetical protein
VGLFSRCIKDQSYRITRLNYAAKVAAYQVLLRAIGYKRERRKDSGLYLEQRHLLPQAVELRQDSRYDGVEAVIARAEVGAVYLCG